MEIMSRISKGTKMDQVYIPKNRPGFSVGSYVVLKPLKVEKTLEKPYFYNVPALEPIKVELITEIMRIIDTQCTYENIIITGSFLDKGFTFNDIDVLIISNEMIDTHILKQALEEHTGIETHIIVVSNKTLVQGLATDPLYSMMLSKCVAKKRLIYKVKQMINYKILDLHLLKSKVLLDNFEMMDGNEKYYLVRNMVAIFLHLQKRKITKDGVDREIHQLFNVTATEIKKNMLEKDSFSKRYRGVYNKTFNLLLDSIKNGS